MRADVVGVALVLSAATVSAQRGVVNNVRVSPQSEGNPAVFTVSGSNPCGAVRIDYGDGNVVTHPLTGVPARIEHAYERAGTYAITAEGMGNCDGRVSGTARVARGIAPPDTERRGEVVDRAELSDWTEARFRQLDADGDGRISRQEWRYGPEQFGRADWNGDGQITRAEFLGETGAVGESAGRRAEERTGSRAEERVEARFERLDANGDAIISRGEWRGAPDGFDRRDVNGDGVITRPEFDNTRHGTETTGTANVRSQVRWNQTGIYIRQGDLVRFDSAGTVQLSDNRRDIADARGSRTGRTAQDAPLPDVPAGSLIARVGDSAPFLVGGEGAVRMPRDGEVLLGINDDYLNDNTGDLRVTVTVNP